MTHVVTLSIRHYRTVECLVMCYGFLLVSRFLIPATRKVVPMFPHPPAEGGVMPIG